MSDQELSRNRSRSEPTELVTAETSESETGDSIPPLPTESRESSSSDHRDRDRVDGSELVDELNSLFSEAETFDVGLDTPYVLIRETRMDSDIEYPKLVESDADLFFDVVQFESGPVAVDSDYVIHFVPEEYVHLSLYDVLTRGGLESYRVGYYTLESMPRIAFDKLNREGHLKCTVDFNESTGVFDEFEMGWQEGVDNVVDVLAEMLLEGGDGLALPVYYFLHTYASDHYSSPEAIAEMRSIKPSSVSEKIREAENEIGDLDSLY